MEKFHIKLFSFDLLVKLNPFPSLPQSNFSLGLVVVGSRIENWYSPTHTRDSGGNVTQKFPVAENSIYTLIIVSEFSCGWSCREGSGSSLNVDIYFNFSSESTQTLFSVEVEIGRKFIVDFRYFIFFRVDIISIVLSRVSAPQWTTLWAARHPTDCESRRNPKKMFPS